MILTQIITFLSLSLTLGNPNNTFYEFGGQISTDIDCDVNIDSSNLQEAVYFVPYLRFTADISFDSEESYYLNNFRFRLYVDSYRLPRGSDTSTLIQSNYVEYDPTWEITANSYNQEISRLSCFFGVDIGNDLLWIDFKYDGVVVESQSFEFGYVGSYSSSSSYTFNGDSFIRSLQSLLDSRYREGYDNGWNDGYSSGYSEGIQTALDTNGEMFTIFNGILNVAAIPINVFLEIFNFEVFGINITSLVTALLSVAILIIVIRVITGKKSE